MILWAQAIQTELMHQRRRAAALVHEHERVLCSQVQQLQQLEPPLAETCSHLLAQ